MCVTKCVVIGNMDNVEGMFEFLLDYIPDLTGYGVPMGDDVERLEAEGTCERLNSCLLKTGILFDEAKKLDVDIEIVSFEGGTMYTGFQEIGRDPILGETIYREPEEEDYDTEEDYYTALDNMYDYYFYL